MMRALAYTGMVSFMLFTFVLQGTPPRTDDPHAIPTQDDTVIGCEGIADYQQALYASLNDHEAFSDYWVNGPRETAEIQQMDTVEVEAIIDDGNALLDELRAMDVPNAYIPAHEGILVLFEHQVRTLTFLTVDASDVPSQEEWERGLALILNGELSTANACPDEIEEAGGFIFFPPDDIQDALS
jgi:hypothetical protein